MLSLIVAISSNHAIGKSGDLLCHLPNDLKHFKAITTGATVVMGKPTFFSLPRHPLPNRRNIVLTHDTSFAFDNTEIAHSIDDLMEMVSADENVFIIGGGNVYEQFINRVDKLYITHIHHSWEDADTFFPRIDPTIWQCTSEEHHEPDDKHLYPYTFAEYSKRK